jgi:hypothetical protein
VDAVIVQDHVNFSLITVRKFRENLIHEGQKFNPGGMWDVVALLL